MIGDNNHVDPACKERRRLFEHAARTSSSILDVALVGILTLAEAIRAEEVNPDASELARIVDTCARDYIERGAQERDRQSAG